MISVLMGIYNCADTLPFAIESILNQTYTDWELILCDDGSKDQTLSVAQSYATKDDRIVVIKNEKNLGLNKTLNKCLSISKGEYIARMDGDDICSPTRFAKEMAVLNAESDISIVSTAMTFFDETGVWGQNSPIEYPEKRDFINGTPINHAPCMVRREAYLAVQGYSELDVHLRCEDYHLWAKMYAKGFRAKNLKEPLYSMRDDKTAYNRRTFNSRLNAVKTRYEVYKMLGIPFYYHYHALRPICVALVPRFIYNIIHKLKLK